MLGSVRSRVYSVMAREEKEDGVKKHWRLFMKVAADLDDRLITSF